MPNPGHPPAHDGLCDIMFRNGQTKRGVDLAKYKRGENRPGFPPEWDFDIIKTQPAKDELT